MSHRVLPPFAATSGPRDAPVVIVGEAWGSTENLLKRPFAGESGKELFRMLAEALPLVEPGLMAETLAVLNRGDSWVGPREAWLRSAGILLTNVLAFQPPDNKVEHLCGKKEEVGGAAYPFQPLQKPGKYLKIEYLDELDRLQAELAFSPRRLIIAFGNTACWALLGGATNIGSIRGTVAKGLGLAEGIKCLPTYHPAAVLRQWSWRTIVVADLMKAWRESTFPEIRRPTRQVLISPSLPEVISWVDRLYSSPPALLANDVETRQGQITVMGFARSRDDALVIPFWDESKPGGNYWPTHGEEVEAWKQCQRALAHPAKKVYQNGCYDFQYLTKAGLSISNMTEDTMLFHHSLFPEMQKGLGFLGSIYSSEASWKLMRTHKADTEKRDE